MELENIISSFVKEVGFSEEECQEITLDLMDMVRIKLIVDLSEDESYRGDIEALRQLEAKQDFVEINSKIKELSEKAGFPDKLRLAFVEVIKDWLENIAGTLPEDKKREIIEKLKRV